MAIVIADFDRIYDQVVSYMNLDAGEAYGVVGATIQSYKPELIKEEIRNKDYEVAKAIMETAGHSLRKFFATEVTLNNGEGFTSLAEVEPPMIEVSNGIFKLGNKTTAQWIERLIGDSDLFFGDTSTVEKGYYDIVGMRLFHNGISAKLLVFQTGKVAKNAETCISPEAYEDVIKNLVLGELYGKQADLLDAAQWYGSRGYAGLQSIREKKMIVPTFVAYTAQE